MDGVFIRKKGINGLILLFLCGVFFIGRYVFLKITEAKDAGELTFLLVGVLCCLTAIPPMLLNRGAFIRLEESRLKAKYHWFGRLDCSIQDIAFVLPQINTLTILLKNGKRHGIMGIENPRELAAAIRRKCFALEKESPHSIQQKLIQAQKARQKAFWGVLGGIGMLFVNIFIAVFLTGGKDLNEFSKLDWTLFTVMAGIELLTIAGLFFVAQRCGKLILPMEQLKHRLRGAIIATHPLPSNYVTAVYTDGNYSGRIVVCGFPNDESVYYCVQGIGEDFKLKTVHSSEIYDNVENLPEEEFSELMDITSYL